MAIIVYTDGSRIGPSVSNVGGPGGAAYVMNNGGVITEYAVGYYKTTNNRAEMMAVILALESLKKKEFVHIFTDSDYTIKAMCDWSFNWRRKRWIKSDGEPVKNVDLIVRLQELMSYHRVRFSWVKGHNGNVLNERCDTLAREAAKHPTKTDAGFIATL